MKTRKAEILLTTSDIREMKGLYLSERLLRSWEEDFVDEDTGDVVKIKRNEIIMEKGTLLDDTNLSEVNFFIQSGDIKEITVSDVKRECTLHERFTSLWVAGVEIGGKTKNIYLYANSVIMANQIVCDFAEQKYKGFFSIKSVRELAYANLIERDEEQNDLDDVYKIEVEITEEGDSFINTFILKASDAENAKYKIANHIAIERAEKGKEIDFELKIIQAKTITCDFLVEYDFSKEHFENID